MAGGGGLGGGGLGGGVVVVAALTDRLKAGSCAAGVLTFVNVAEITMFGYVPTLALLGVPMSCPELVLKVAQRGTL